MDIKINHTKLDVNTQNLENEIKPQIEEVDLKLDSQTKDNLNRQIPEENLDFNLTKLDLSVSLQNSSSEIPFEEDFKGFDTDKGNGFSNSEKYKNNSININYKQSIEKPQEEIKVGINYVNQKNRLQGSSTLQYKHNSSSDKISTQVQASKKFNILNGDAEINGNLIVSNKNDEQNSQSFFNSKISSSYEHNIIENDNINIDSSSKITAEGTIQDKNISTAKISADTSLLMEKKSLGVFSTGGVLSAGISNNLVTNDLIDAGLITKFGMELFKKFEIEDKAYLKLSGGINFAGNSDYQNKDYVLKGDLNIPISLKSEKYFKVETKYNYNYLSTKKEDSETKNLNIGAILENYNDKDIYAKYSYDITNKKHSATIGAKIKI